jgi:hypothetical protein
MNPDWKRAPMALRGFLTAAIWGVLLTPVMVLVHELGHLAVLWAGGVGSLTLSYSSSGFPGQPEFWRLLRAGDDAGAAHIAPIGVVGASDLMGLVVSYAWALGGLAAFARRGSPILLALSLAAGARFPLVLLLFGMGRSEHTDEAHAALTLGIPVQIMVFLGLLVTVSVSAFGVGVRRRERRVALFAGAVVGVVVGVVLWLGHVGPAVLP